MYRITGSSMSAPAYIESLGEAQDWVQIHYESCHAGDVSALCQRDSWHFDVIVNGKIKAFYAIDWIEGDCIDVLLG